MEQGVLEVTLLGQNVNSYGRSFGDRDAFGKLLRAVGATGLERVRFTSPHPRDFTDDVIAAMAETPAVCPSLHMPLQSGSDEVLKRMRRSYRSERFLGILERVRAQIPDAAITTDVIVGFPGETDAGLRGDPAGRRGVALRRRLHLPVLHRARARPAADYPDQVAARGRRRALPAARRAAGPDHLRGHAGAGRHDRRGAAVQGRGAQGRPGPDDRPGPRQPPRAPHPRRRGPARATSSPPSSPAPRRTTCWRTARCSRTGAPGRETCTRRVRRRGPPASASGCRPSAPLPDGGNCLLFVRFARFGLRTR